MEIPRALWSAPPNPNEVSGTEIRYPNLLWKPSSLLEFSLVTRNTLLLLHILVIIGIWAYCIEFSLVDFVCLEDLGRSYHKLVSRESFSFVTIEFS